MTFHSQAGQDQWALAVIGNRPDGRFIDVGCSHPTEINNTWAMEQLGWTGILIDSSLNSVEMCRQLRKAPVICADATVVDWAAMMAKLHPEWGSAPTVDYASVDIDEWTFAALANLVSVVLPAVLTVEHDFYQRGDKLRVQNRRLLGELGYDMVAGDVHSAGCNFEDWFVHPAMIQHDRYDRFRSVGLEWRDVLKKGGVL